MLNARRKWRKLAQCEKTFVLIGAKNTRKAQN